MTDFEQQLRKVKPAAPSPVLMRRLEVTRPVPAARHEWGWQEWLFRVLMPATAAAAVALTVLWHEPKQEQAPVVPPVAEYEPVESQNFVLGAKQVGIGRTEEGVPYRLVQCVGVRRETWKKTSDGSEVAVVVPQQEIILAKMDVY
jgi:hypothetical protein